MTYAGGHFGGSASSRLFSRTGIPLPPVIYRRDKAYRHIAPAFETLISEVPAFIGLPEVNLCDYWDYIEGLLFEAYDCALHRRSRPLRRLSVFVTDECNLNCRACPQKGRHGRTIDIGWLKDNLATARDEGCMFFDVMGLGEPTLIDSLPELLRMAADLGMIPTLGTNGATANLADDAYVSRLLEVTPIKFRVSLDSSDPAEHDRARGRTGSWTATVRFLNFITHARSEKKITAGVFVNKLVTRHNVHAIMDDLQHCADLGVDDVHLIPVRFDKDLLLSRQQIERFNEETAPRIRELAERYRLAWLGQNVFPFGQTPAEIERASLGQYYTPPLAADDCFIQKGQLLVDACQNVWTCLWSRRNGGRPVLESDGRPKTVKDMRSLVCLEKYPSVAPVVCQSRCTAWIVEANNRVACALATTSSATGKDPS